MLDFGFYNMDCMQGMKQFPDKYFDLAIVDPPYGDVTQGGYMTNPHSCDKLAKAKEYHLSIWKNEKPQREYFLELKRVSKNQIIWGGNYYASQLNDSQGWIIWDKENGKNSFADAELAWTSFDRAVRIYKFRWSGMLQGDMKEKEIRIHPTQKPVALYEWILNNYAQKNDIVLDTHVGSASSLVACRNTGHKYVGFEIDPVYYQLAKERLNRAESQTQIFDFIEE